MHGKQKSFSKSLFAAAALALAASGQALADDNSMSRLTGDSYAFFNGLEYHAGGFNVARATSAQGRDAVVEAPAKKSRDVAERRTLLADRPANVFLPSPFRDDKGA